MLDESIFTKVRCLMGKVLMGFDERNALNTNFLKAIFSVTGRVSTNVFLFLLNAWEMEDYCIRDVDLEMAGFISSDLLMHNKNLFLFHK